jgi:hypothetical protein
MNMYLLNIPCYIRASVATSTNARALQRDRKNQLIDESALKLHLASTQAMVSDCACEDIQCMHRFEDI